MHSTTDSLGDQLRREAASTLRQRPLQAFRLQSLAGQVDVMQAELDQLKTFFARAGFALILKACVKDRDD